MKIARSPQRNSEMRQGLSSSARRDDPGAAGAAEAAQIAARAFVIFDQVQRKSSAATRTRLLNAAPCCMRHCEQWQFNGLNSGPVIPNLMPPQRQVPRTGGMMVSLKPKIAVLAR